MKGQYTMTNKQLNAFIEALKIIVDNSSDRENIVEYLDRIQDKLNE